MAEYLTNTTDLTLVADAIRIKGGTTELLTYPEEFISAIEEISLGIVPQLIVTVSAGATVTATNGSKTITGTSDNTGVCTLAVPETGTWSVSATLDGQTSDTKTVSITDSYAVSLNFVYPSLNENTWETIKNISDAGQGANYWSIGDRKEVTLNGTVGHLSLSNYTTYAFIIGFNHNASVEGTNRIHFQLAKTALSGGTDVALCDSSYRSNVSTTGYFSMNSSATNSGGWENSNMRNAICGTSLLNYSGTMIAVIPDALREVLKSVTKYTDNTGGGSSAESNVTATTDYFFLLSEFEVFGNISYGNKAEKLHQEQYAYYSTGNSKIKYKHDEPSVSAAWWTRSPYASYYYLFVLVDTDGTPDRTSADTSLAFAPGFCV